MLIRFESNMVDSFDKEYREKMGASIDAREEELKASLEKNVRFNTEILGGTVAIHLYNYDQGELKKSLVPFMNYPEIFAVTVLDEANEVYSAAWKNLDVVVGDSLPEDFKLNDKLFVEVASTRDEERLGTLQVYYTDSILTEKIKGIKEKALIQAENFHDTSRSQLNWAIINQTIGTGLILLALMVCLVSFLKILVKKPLIILSHSANKLAGLDLTITTYPKTKDEIGRLLAAINTLSQSFRDVVGQVQQTGIHVTSTATELSATAKEQELIVGQQVESMDDVVKSVQKISDVATHLVHTMRQVASISQETTQFVGSGQDDLTHMQQAMHQMENASKSISGRLEAINEKAENITTVVTTISRVAEQTNLLSLNAAIEAEKAGEYGRGFTIVAREIRRLADQTAFATLDITQMVHEMQSAVSSGVMEMDKFIADVRQSAEDVSNISTHLTRVIEQVQALSPNFDEVNEAMGHQSEHVQKINSAMQNLSEEMQETKSSLKETYSAIGQLNEAAMKLQGEVSRFKVS